MRIVFIGAGSVVFTRNLTRDILTFPELADCEIVLMDIDADRLSRAERLVSRMAEHGQGGTAGHRHRPIGARPCEGPTTWSSRSRWRHGPVGPRHVRPGTLGVGQCVGDTWGPAESSAGLRHLAVFDDLIGDMTELCPRPSYCSTPTPWPSSHGGRPCRVSGSSAFATRVQGTAASLR